MHILTCSGEICHYPSPALPRMGCKTDCHGLAPAPHSQQLELHAICSPLPCGWCDGEKNQETKGKICGPGLEQFNRTAKRKTNDNKNERI